MQNILVKLFGWKATLVHGDPPVIDRWRFARRHLAPGPLRTLDAGCGSGAFTMYAAKIGNEAVGVSFDERNNALAQCRADILGIKNIRFIQGDLRFLERFEEGLGVFDQILCFENIEHIKNDKKLLRDLTRLLRPHGRILLTAPFKHYIPLLGDRISEEEDGGHVRWGYTHEEMRRMFEDCGLTVTSEEFISGFISQKLTNLMRRLSRIDMKLAWLLTFPVRLLQLLDEPATRLTAYPYLSIGVVGCKQ